MSLSWAGTVPGGEALSEVLSFCPVDVSPSEGSGRGNAGLGCAVARQVVPGSSGPEFSVIASSASCAAPLSPFC